MSVQDPTTTFGITSRNRKYVELSGSRMSRAINGMSAHHRAEVDAVSKAAFDSLGDLGSSPLNLDPRRLATIAATLRQDREALMDVLEELRDPLLDAIADAHTLLPPNAMRLEWVDPEPQPPAPTPLASVAADLSPVDRLKILHQNLIWTQDISRWLSLEAYAAASALVTIIEWPTPEATRLRELLDTALRALPPFILRKP